MSSATYTWLTVSGRGGRHFDRGRAVHLKGVAAGFGEGGDATGVAPALRAEREALGVLHVRQRLDGVLGLEVVREADRKPRPPPPPPPATPRGGPPPP